MSIAQLVKSWFSFLSKKERPLISVVLLLRKPIQLTDDRLRHAVVKGWGRDLRTETNEYIANKPPVCFVRFDDFVLLINNITHPYVSEEYRQQQASREFRELRQLRVVMEHNAFFTVDLMEPQNPTRNAKAKAYRQMCSLAAEFVDENCLGVSFPETGYLRAYDDTVKDALRSSRPLEAIKRSAHIPVIGAVENDAKLTSAASEARERWNEFVRAFNNRRPDQMFSVKAPFRDDENVEWMWVNVMRLTEDMVEGLLGNAPVSLGNLHEGDSVRVPTKVVADWIYSDGNKVFGGFSLKVLGRSNR